MQLLGRGVNGYTTLLLEINTIFQFNLYIVMGRGIFSAKVYKMCIRDRSNEIGDYIELQKHLSRRFDTKVELKRNESGKGKIIIGFKSDAELEKIIELLDKIE